MKILLAIIVSINLCYAGNIEIIKKGNKANYDGFLVDKSQMETFRKINEQKKLSEAKNLVLSDLSITQGGIIDFHKKRAQKLNESLSRANLGSYLSNVLFFGLGVLATVVIAKNIPR